MTDIGPEPTVVVAPGLPQSAGLDLVAEMEALPASPTAAIRVLFLAEDPKSSAGDLGGVVASDPSLTARVMKMANSAYYGLSGRVGSATFAVTVLGFDTVRAIAATTAAGISGDSGTLPDGFWTHAASVAVGCSLVGSRVSIRGPEAFSLGLLHDLGQALLHRGLGPLPDGAPVESAERLALERGLYGIDHATAAARVLRAWWFPAEFADAIAGHHDDPATVRANLHRTLLGGEALANLALGTCRPVEAKPGLAAVSLEPSAVPPLVERVRSETEGLAASLASL
jgi:HD-like signal output (HDOD) protein